VTLCVAEHYVICVSFVSRHVTIHLGWVIPSSWFAQVSTGFVRFVDREEISYKLKFLMTFKLYH
jgi:hypothetical protein